MPAMPPAPAVAIAGCWGTPAIGLAGPGRRLEAAQVSIMDEPFGTVSPLGLSALWDCPVSREVQRRAHPAGRSRPPSGAGQGPILSLMHNLFMLTTTILSQTTTPDDYILFASNCRMHMDAGTIKYVTNSVRPTTFLPFQTSWAGMPISRLWPTAADVWWRHAVRLD
jgi:hypothetical protein